MFEVWPDGLSCRSARVRWELQRSWIMLLGIEAQLSSTLWGLVLLTRASSAEVLQRSSGLKPSIRGNSVIITAGSCDTVLPGTCLLPVTSAPIFAISSKRHEPCCFLITLFFPFLKCMINYKTCVSLVQPEETCAAMTQAWNCPLVIGYLLT